MSTKEFELYNNMSDKELANAVKDASGNDELANFVYELITALRLDAALLRKRIRVMQNEIMRLRPSFANFATARPDENNNEPATKGD